MAADLSAAVTTRDRCAGCASASLAAVLDLGSSPLADRFPEPGAAEEWFPLRVVVCTSCWLMQLADVVPGGDLYGADYGFLTGASPASLGYFAAVAADLLAVHRERLTGGLVVEVACNDGTLLRHFADAGCRVLGVEPAGPPAAAARARGLEVLQEPFTAGVAAAIGPGAALVLAFNVAAHVADPLGFLAGIRALLAPGGVAVVEVQYAGDLIAGCQFDHVYHEHRFFFSMASFAALAAQAGLVPLAWQHVPAQGGSVRVTLAREGTAAPIPAGEGWLSAAHTYAGLQDRAAYLRERLLALLAAELYAGRVVAGYGATAKSATLLNFCGIGPELVPWVEDVTPAKIGRLTPGTHIPIVKPGERGAPDSYLLLAWNYAGDVLRRERDFTGGGGRFIVPGPVPVIL